MNNSIHHAPVGGRTIQFEEVASFSSKDDASFSATFSPFPLARLQGQLPTTQPALLTLVRFGEHLSWVQDLHAGMSQLSKQFKAQERKIHKDGIEIAITTQSLQNLCVVSPIQFHPGTVAVGPKTSQVRDILKIPSLVLL